MASPRKLAHIVFWTENLEPMVSWYCAVLDAHVVFSNPIAAFLTYDDEHHRVAILKRTDLAPRPGKWAVGFYHAAFTYDSLEALLDNYDRLAAMGIRPARAINHGPTISIYYVDPDGNDIELQIDSFENPDDATAMMRGEAFSKDHIGPNVDPDALKRRLQSGEPLADILRRADEQVAP